MLLVALGPVSRAFPAGENPPSEGQARQQLMDSLMADWLSRVAPEGPAHKSYSAASVLFRQMLELSSNDSSKVFLALVNANLDRMPDEKLASFELALRDQDPFNDILVYQVQWILARNRGVRQPSPLEIMAQYNAQALGASAQARPELQQLDSMLVLWHHKRFTPAFLAGRRSKLAADSMAFDLPDSVYAARIAAIVTPIELAYNQDVRTYIHHYTNPRAKTYIQSLVGRTEYYAPTFEQVLDAYGLPLELKYLPIIESGLNPNAVSIAGATGIWQFMYSTGKMYDLDVTRYVDQRSDPLKATHAAARMFTDLYAKYGDWALCLAAYNCGSGNVDRAINRAGGVKDYWAISRFLPRETQGYVPKFIAATYLMSYYDQHGFSSTPYSLPSMCQTVTVDSTNLYIKQIAEVVQVSEEEILALNPQYKRNVVPAKEQSMTLNLPYLAAARFQALQDSVYAYASVSTPVRNVAPAQGGTAVASTTQLSNVVPSDDNYVYYRIQSGENLWTIAQKFPGVSNTDLMRLNNLTASATRQLRPGQVIKIKPKD